MKKIKKIHVDQHRIRGNIHLSPDKRLAPITVRTSQGVFKGNVVEVLDDQGNVVCKFIYGNDNPLSCGARLWVETRQPIRIDDGRREIL